MKKLFLIPALVVASAISVPAFSASAEITSGIWSREDGNARVRISPCGASLCAINVWIRNPGSEKVGDKLVLNVKPTSAGTLEGTAFDPQRNLRFSSKITFSGDRMTTSGCVLGGLICKSSGWTRQ